MDKILDLLHGPKVKVYDRFPIKASVPWFAITVAQGLKVKINELFLGIEAGGKRCSVMYANVSIPVGACCPDDGSWTNQQEFGGVVTNPFDYHLATWLFH